LKFEVGLDESFFIDSPEAEEKFTTCSQMSINDRKQPTDAARQEFVAKIQERFAQRCTWMNQHKAQAMDKDWLSSFVDIVGRYDVFAES